MKSVKILERLIGNPIDGITTVYGTSGTGKSCLCMMCSIQTVNSDKKVIYIDSDNRFSIDRLKQLSLDYEKILQKIMILQPRRFFQQYQMLQKVQQGDLDSVGLLVVDSIAELYRFELAKSMNKHEVGKYLGSQMRILEQISKRIPVLITSHAYDNLKEKRSMVSGGDWLRKRSKYLIELKITPNGRKAILANPRKIINFEIKNEGIILQ